MKKRLSSLRAAALPSRLRTNATLSAIAFGGGISSRRDTLAGRAWSSLVAIVLLSCATSTVTAETLLEYKFEGNTNDSSGSGLHGELIGDAMVQEGRLFLPGGLDNTMSIPLGEFSPFDGTVDWTISFQFQTVDESTGPLFSADGSAQCAEDDTDCRDAWPENEETGDQTGGLNVFLDGDGFVRTDFWYIGVVASLEIYNDDELHTYVGTYVADTGEFTQVIDGEDEAFGVFAFERDTSQDRNHIGDETNGDFGFEFNLDGFHGYFDEFTIDSAGKIPDKAPTGDFNQNGVLDAADIDDLTAQSASGANLSAYDLNADSLVNESDINVWIKTLYKSWVGDADLNREFNTTDLVEVLASGSYEADVPSVWSTGDFNGDGRTNTTDLVEALADGGYEQGVPVAAVPEPAGAVLLSLGGLSWLTRGRRSSKTTAGRNLARTQLG
jgi:hypothetical protein